MSYNYRLTLKDNQISLNIDQDNDLPITITINGNEYYSNVEVARRTTEWYRLGETVGEERGYKKGIEEVKDHTYTDKEMNATHNHFFHEGYTKGIEESKRSFHNEMETVRKLAYEQGKSAGYENGYELGYNDGHNAGYEKGKYDKGISEIIPGEYLAKMEEEYDKGYAEGYNDCRELTDMLIKYGKREEPVEPQEVPEEYVWTDPRKLKGM